MNQYITSPIYYVNDIPHIGHAYTSIACDIYARWQTLNKRDVYFLTGTDEHGQKVEKSAISKNQTPTEYCDKVSNIFNQLTVDLNLTNNDFIRTTQERHKVFAQNFWSKLETNGWIYKGYYKGWYAVRDEAFYDESELIDGKAPTGAPVEWREEESYFFKLSFFGEFLLEVFRLMPDFIKPSTRFNEVVSFVSGGLKDLCISRTSFKWGVEVPHADNHVMYVWLDALTNYLSALESKNLTSKYWLNAKKTHIVGKDILRFHAVYWPAFLLAAEFEYSTIQSHIPSEFCKQNFDTIKSLLPTQIFAHGWWTNEGQKISKSLGNVINPYDLINQFGIDKLRYFLFAEVVFGSDGDFNISSFISRTNADLANNIGNLLQRTLKLYQKNCGFEVDMQVPEIEAFDLLSKFDVAINTFQYHEALSLLIKYSSFANEFFDKNAPWSLFKEGKVNEAKQVLAQILKMLTNISICLTPFCPSSAEKMMVFMGLDHTNIASIINIKRLKTTEPQVLFERYAIK